MLEIIQDLCRESTGSRCHLPRLSSWRLVEPSQSNIGVDVADVASAGGGAVVPINIKAYGSYLLCGLENDQIGISSQIQGLGVGVGLGMGWGIPFVGGRAVGRVPSGIKRELLKRLGGSIQGKIIDMISDLMPLEVSGGTRIIAGPDAPRDLTTQDFHNSWATVFAFGANFVVNGVSVGLIIVSKHKPVIDVDQLIHARAIGVIAGVGLATSLDLEGSGMAYRVGLG